MIDSSSGGKPLRRYSRLGDDGNILGDYLCTNPRHRRRRRWMPMAAEETATNRNDDDETTVEEEKMVVVVLINDRKRRWWWWCSSMIVINCVLIEPAEGKGEFGKIECAF
eukprot:CAMPEP_0201911640 /NCGR_PEP_ID=MMETSP0903-20130614/2517_1 /ASSEMBLY_ACC=CAM_ASM_000552 /TAXON_ID=420261 /ORGANISM="Thalassiosira antarctica, Strain CCMP982" /LENGTH=109 /DNA_ID=CAMNT_0048446393 /DNA_START=326 /DNA_END=655 /DNA_ORIENTATION=+